MKSRWIAVLVCALYMSVGTLFAAVHCHEDESPANEQCTACAWHHGAQVDVPRAAVVPTPPRVVIYVFATTEALHHDISVETHPSRGPPFVSL